MINSKQHWQCTNKKSVKIDRSRAGKETYRLKDRAIDKTEARQKLTGIYFIELDDAELKETIQKTHGKVGDSDGRGYPLQTGNKEAFNKPRETDDETQGSNKIQKTKHACIVEAHESTRKRYERILPKDHKPETQEVKQDYWFRLKKMKDVSVERISGESYQWKAKGQCRNRGACSFRHDGSKRGKKTQSSSPAPRP